MGLGRFANLARNPTSWFPERHIYLRTGGDVRGYVLTTSLQMKIAAAVAALAFWTGGATAALIVSAADSSRDATAPRYGEARSSGSAVQTEGPSRSLETLANTMERRHEVLAMLLVGASGEAGEIATITPARIDSSAPAAQRIEAVRRDQERMITAVEGLAKSRADRLRLAFRLAGLDPAAYAGVSDGLGGPLIEAKDPRALAAILDVDENFARRIETAAADVTAMRSLADVGQTLPLGKPTAEGDESSPYGFRIDPFTGRPAFHSGEDFSGPYMTAINATAPGVVSFAGVRSGYGNTIEIDHGHGFKTRYGHLAAISVRVGQHVGLGQRIGGMGSTGRSTGDHLHYEVWVNGRPQNPSRFLKAGDYVQQTE